ncbi:MAG: hypothetical protein PHT32_07670, partial [Candidatus Omnitrophica bacterium]|nr:hypothetical protein [Candidatus Omnitrophota bacterium]
SVASLRDACLAKARTAADQDLVMFIKKLELTQTMTKESFIRALIDAIKPTSVKAVLTQALKTMRLGDYQDQASFVQDLVAKTLLVTGGKSPCDFNEDGAVNAQDLTLYETRLMGVDAIYKTALRTSLDPDSFQAPLVTVLAGLNLDSIETGEALKDVLLPLVSAAYSSNEGLISFVGASAAAYMTKEEFIQELMAAPVNTVPGLMAAGRSFLNATDALRQAMEEDYRSTRASASKATNLVKEAQAALKLTALLSEEISKQKTAEESRSMYVLTGLIKEAVQDDLTLVTAMFSTRPDDTVLVEHKASLTTALQDIVQREESQKQEVQKIEKFEADIEALADKAYGAYSAVQELYAKMSATRDAETIRSLYATLEYNINIIETLDEEFKTVRAEYPNNAVISSKLDISLVRDEAVAYMKANSRRQLYTAMALATPEGSYIGDAVNRNIRYLNTLKDFAASVNTADVIDAIRGVAKTVLDDIGELIGCGEVAAALPEASLGLRQTIPTIKARILEAQGLVDAIDRLQNTVAMEDTHGLSQADEIMNLYGAAKVVYQMIASSGDAAMVGILSSVLEPIKEQAYALIYDPVNGCIAAKDSAIAAGDPSAAEWTANVASAIDRYNQLITMIDIVAKDSALLTVKDAVTESQKYATELGGIIVRFDIADMDSAEGLLENAQDIRAKIIDIYRNAVKVSAAYSTNSDMRSNMTVLKGIVENLDARNGLMDRAKAKYYYRAGLETKGQKLKEICQTMQASLSDLNTIAGTYTCSQGQLFGLYGIMDIASSIDRDYLMIFDLVNTNQEFINAVQGTGVSNDEFLRLQVYIDGFKNDFGSIIGGTYSSISSAFDEQLRLSGNYVGYTTFQERYEAFKNYGFNKEFEYYTMSACAGLMAKFSTEINADQPTAPASARVAREKALLGDTLTTWSYGVLTDAFDNRWLTGDHIDAMQVDLDTISVGARRFTNDVLVKEAAVPATADSDIFSYAQALNAGFSEYIKAGRAALELAPKEFNIRQAIARYQTLSYLAASYTTIAHAGQIRDMAYNASLSLEQCISGVSTTVEGGITANLEGLTKTFDRTLKGTTALGMGAALTKVAEELSKRSQQPADDYELKGLLLINDMIQSQAVERNRQAVIAGYGDDSTLGDFTASAMMNALEKVTGYTYITANRAETVLSTAAVLADRNEEITALKNAVD